MFDISMKPTEFVFMTTRLFIYLYHYQSDFRHFDICPVDFSFLLDSLVQIIRIILNIRIRKKLYAKQ